MIPITKAEKDKLVKAFPPYEYPHYYCYPRTMRQKSKRGHYFCVESPELLSMLQNIRRQDVVEEYDRRNELRQARQKLSGGDQIELRKPHGVSGG